MIRLKVDMCLYNQGGFVIKVGTNTDFCFKIIKYNYFPDTREVIFYDLDRRISLHISPDNAELVYGQNYREYFYVSGASNPTDNAKAIEYMAEKFVFKEKGGNPSTLLYHYMGF